MEMFKFAPINGDRLFARVLSLCLSNLDALTPPEFEMLTYYQNIILVIAIKPNTDITNVPIIKSNRCLSIR